MDLALTQEAGPAALEGPVVADTVAAEVVVLGVAVVVIVAVAVGGHAGGLFASSSLLIEDQVEGWPVSSEDSMGLLQTNAEIFATNLRTWE